MLYQIWLGYSIGIWALLVQGFWAFSYVLLALHVKRVRDANSLHSFLGKSFGRWTQILAGLCSITGFTLLVGWEFNVGKSTFDGLLNFNASQTVTPSLVMTFTFATVFASFLYTVVGGLRSNAFANTIQNIIKFIVFCTLIFFLCKASQTSSSTFSLQNALFPSFSQVITSLGVWGLITNLAFSLVWQFVDMSTWQSVIASSKKLDVDGAKSALRFGGLVTFIAPGIIGTLLGAFLVGTVGVTDSNVMMKVVDLLPDDSPVVLFCILVAILASIMSTIDGLLLAAAYTLVCDLVHSGETLEQLDEKRIRAEGTLVIVRLFIGVIALTGTLGVLVGLVQWLNISLFDLFYVVIVSQLALTGPVLVGLRSQTTEKSRMVYAIISGLVIGFGAFAASRITGQEWLMQGAGVFAMMMSIAVAEITTRLEG